MSNLDRDKTYNNLKKKGFIDSSRKNKDHFYLELYHNGKLIAHTKVSHSKEDIRDRLIKEMSTQCKLDKNQFMDLAKCPLSKEAYLEILQSKDLLD